MLHWLTDRKNVAHFVDAQSETALLSLAEGETK
jgi:hypothetical protein